MRESADEFTLDEAAHDHGHGTLVGVRPFGEFVHREHFVSTQALEDEELRSADAEPLLCVSRGHAKLAN